MAKVKRSQIAHFLDTTPAAAATYVRIGDGVTSATENYNPTLNTETYIHQDSGSASLDSYAPTLPIDGQVFAGDPAYEFIATLRRGRVVGAGAETNLVNVDLYATPVGGAYPAEKERVVVSIESRGGDGGSTAGIAYTLNYIGDPVLGTFNPTTLTFTAA